MIQWDDISWIVFEGIDECIIPFLIDNTKYKHMTKYSGLENKQTMQASQ